MLHLIYIFAFAVLAFLAIGNLIRNIFTLGIDSQRMHRPRQGNESLLNEHGLPVSQSGIVAHPELLDALGNVVEEPLLVMRSMTVEDAREQLDALYESSPGYEGDSRD
jgi:Protein of unknown function (DUF2973)